MGIPRRCSSVSSPIPDCIKTLGVFIAPSDMITSRATRIRWVRPPQKISTPVTRFPSKVSRVTNAPLSCCEAQKLFGLFDAGHREVRRIKQSHLHEQCSLVPPHVLIRDFPVLAFH